MKWSNNYFNIAGSNHNLKITQKTGGAVIVPMYADKFILIKIRRVDGHFHWEFPRGFTEKGESSEQTSIRELCEELNITDIDRIDHLGSIMPDSGLIDSLINIYSIRIIGISHINLQNSEHIIKFKLVTLHQLEDMIDNGIITDGFTMSAFLKWKLHGDSQ